MLDYYITRFWKALFCGTGDRIQFDVFKCDKLKSTNLSRLFYKILEDRIKCDIFNLYLLKKYIATNWSRHFQVKM